MVHLRRCKSVNIVDTVGVTGGQTTKGAVNIGNIVGVSGSKISRVSVQAEGLRNPHGYP